MFDPLRDKYRHANNHFEEEELARDMELAQHIALASTSPHTFTMDNDSSFESFFGEDPKTSASICNAKMSDHGEVFMQEKISCLVSLQIRSSFHKVEGGLMALLRRCLELETENSTSIISGHVDHFQSVESEDTGWGCGWRNIQMLCSNLLMQRQEARELMFGGSGFVPDIPSLQRWLEIAWERDFDMLGSNSFNYKIYGSTKWIGATECATLFRSFGLRARIVDFGNKEIESLCYGANRGTKKVEINSRDKKKVKQVYGPMDKFLLDSDRLTKEDNKLNKYMTRKMKGHQVLIDWVWNYFAEKNLNRLGSHQRVIVSDKTPLYFQHNGHSRTIVGIQVKQPLHGRPKQYTLLILDPGHRTEALERSLNENLGWQKLIKRGVHTLKKPQYQLCYIDPGVADSKEMEQLKTIDSIYFES
ncbi:Peptidase C78 [Macleaya cordata]|uniref:Peptidase C78 n=1 Tax=Macleaya cordata TaxID=56857 RepID=A0A200Q0N3_MACCD|nr:Peptidase C78 [Macleaya cordata]